MNNISIIAVDIAKNYFHFCIGDSRGKVIERKKLARKDVIAFMHHKPRCLVVMEACGGANFWGRAFMELGFQVKLIAPQFVKPFCKSNKNDRNDAEAIMEAALRPTMRFVGVKTLIQQDVQSIHRLRQSMIKQRTAIANEIRGLLLEYGVAIPQGISHIRKGLGLKLETESAKITDTIREIVIDLASRFRDIDERIDQIDRKLKSYALANSFCKRAMQREGVGPTIATAIVSYIGDPHMFKRGRDLSAYFGIVPSQHSTGGKAKLGRISKRGDRYIRQLLIHGARSVVRISKNRTDPLSLWVQGVWQRRGFNKACVALANKNARLLWALLADDLAEYKKTA